MTPRLDAEDPIEIRLTEEMPVDREMLRAMRPERGGASVAPARHVEHEIHAGPLVQPIGAAKLPGGDRRRPDPALDRVRRAGLGPPPRRGGGGNGVAREPADRDVIGMAVGAVGVEGRGHGRAFAADDRHQRAPDRVGRGVGELPILEIQQVQSV